MGQKGGGGEDQAACGQEGLDGEGLVAKAVVRAEPRASHDGVVTMAGMGAVATTVQRAMPRW